MYLYLVFNYVAYILWLRYHNTLRNVALSHLSWDCVIDFVISVCVWHTTNVNILSIGSNTKMEKSSFWWNFRHWLHRKLSKWQLPVQPVMKISWKWWHFYFSDYKQADMKNESVCNNYKISWPKYQAFSSSFNVLQYQIFHQSQHEAAFQVDLTFNNPHKMSCLNFWWCYNSLGNDLQRPVLCYIKLFSYLNWHAVPEYSPVITLRLFPYEFWTIWNGC